ncbi:FecR domain-containing protein [bacterium]
MNTTRTRFVPVLAVLLFCCSSMASAQQLAVTIHDITGTVETRVNVATAWEKAEAGIDLPEGAYLRTGSDSSCIIRWREGHAVRMDPFSILQITSMKRDAAGNDASNLNLNVGKIYTHVEKLGGRKTSFEIRTPTVMAGVRGTDFFVEVREDSTSIIGVTDGEIFVEAPGFEITLYTNYLVVVDPDGVADDPEPISEPERLDTIQKIEEMLGETELGKADVEPEEKAALHEASSAKEETEATGTGGSEERLTSFPPEIVEAVVDEPEQSTPIIESDVVIPDVEQPEVEQVDNTELVDDVLDTIVYTLDENITTETIDTILKAQETGLLEVDIHFDE